MFFVSPTLTALMLAIVPPVSFGAVRLIHSPLASSELCLGILRPVFEETLDQDPRSSWRDD